MQEENNVGINMIWALTTLIIVAIIAGAIFYSGVLNKKGTPDTDVDINVTAPVNK
ncbi:MAG: hypothetical protein R2747_03055 [Pyrinomonadaceae bacterium]